MPYIDQTARARLAAGGAPINVGELTYALTQVVLRYLKPRARFADYAEVLAALEATKLELYRRNVAHYEDGKCAANGDVYPNGDDIEDAARILRPDVCPMCAHKIAAHSTEAGAGCLAHTPDQQTYCRCRAFRPDGIHYEMELM